MHKFLLFANRILLLTAVLVCVTSQAVAQGVGAITRIEKDRVTIDWGVMDGTTVGMYFDAYKMMGRPQAAARTLSPKDAGFVGRLRVDEIYNDYAIAGFVVQKQDATVGDFLQLVIDDQNPLDVPGFRTDKGVITDVKQGMASVNLGRQDGVESGLLFDVVKYLMRTDPATGEPADRRRLLVGKIAVMDVDNEQSVTRILTGAKNISVGDHVELSDRQRGDIEMSRQADESSAMPATPEPDIAGIMLRPEVLGRVDGHRGDHLDVFWKDEQTAGQVPMGTRFGVYRLEVVENALTGVQIGAPMVRIGEAELTDINGQRGTARLIMEDVTVKPGDLVGSMQALEPQVTTSLPPATPKTTVGTSGAVARERRTRDQAYQLSSEIIQAQREINDLKALAGRISNLESSVRKNSTNLSQIRQLVQRIDDRLTDNVQVGGEKSELEIYGSNADDANVKRYVFSDDIDVKVMFKDNTAFLMLEMDTTGMVTQAVPVSDSTAREMTKTDILPEPDGSETSVDSLLALDAESSMMSWLKKFGLYGGILLAVVAVGMGAMMFLKKKKGGGGAAPAAVDDDDDDDYDEDEDEEEEEEDDDLETVTEEELEEDVM